jgi:hypothetical protein
LALRIPPACQSLDYLLASEKEDLLGVVVTGVSKIQENLKELNIARTSINAYQPS